MFLKIAKLAFYYMIKETFIKGFEIEDIYYNTYNFGCFYP